MKIALICQGNIVRSQILEHYIRLALRELGLEADLFSCGLAPATAYPNDRELLGEVQAELDRRGLSATVTRTSWSPESAHRIEASDLVLVADGERRSELLRRTRLQPSKVFLFYEFVGEGRKDFPDTLDANTGRQHPGRFVASFDELSRIAHLAAPLIREMQLR